MMPDGIAVLAEDVEDRLVPILAFAHAALGTFRRRQPARVAEIIGRIVALDVGQEAQVRPAPLLRPGFEPRDRRFGDDIERGALPDVEGTAVDRVEHVRTAGTGPVAFGPEHEALKDDAGLVPRSD